MSPPSEEALPDAPALLVATLALMTAWAVPCPHARVEVEALRRLLARKIRANLFLLHLHPQMVGGARQIALNLQQRWESLSEDTAPLPCHGAVAASGMGTQEMAGESAKPAALPPAGPGRLH